MGATYTVPEAAERLDVSSDTVYRSIAAGTFLVPTFKVGRQIRVPKAPLERLLETGTTVLHTAAREDVA